MKHNSYLRQKSSKSCYEIPRNFLLYRKTLFDYVVLFHRFQESKSQVPIPILLVLLVGRFFLDKIRHSLCLYRENNRLGILPVLGDIELNFEAIVEAMNWAIIFPEIILKEY
jgi:hypothetical protein